MRSRFQIHNPIALHWAVARAQLAGLLPGDASVRHDGVQQRGRPRGAVCADHLQSKMMSHALVTRKMFWNCLLCFADNLCTWETRQAWQSAMYDEVSWQSWCQHACDRLALFMGPCATTMLDVRRIHKGLESNDAVSML